MNIDKVIIDTREKKIYHILKYLKKNNIQFEIKKIDSGDYSFWFRDKDYSNIFSIERKASLDELALNFTKTRKTFKEEFNRAKNRNQDIILLVESNYKNIKMHNYRSKFHPNAFLASLKSWKEKGLIAEIYFGKKENTAEFMIKIFEQYIKKKL
ncbi:MAG: ERCC4 domain-containing protein [Clostridiales bacterium]